jgi:hypothetical protein
MKNRMAVSRCCCEPTGPTLVEPDATITTLWSDYETSGANITISGLATDPAIDFYSLIGLQSFAWSWRFPQGDIPLSLATAVMRFTGAASGAPEPNQTFAIYATKLAGTSYPFSAFEGPVNWVNGVSDVWGVSGSTRTTPDLAAIINAVTGDAGFTFATDQVLIVLRCLTLGSAADVTRFLDNTAPLQVAELEYTV